MHQRSPLVIRHLDYGVNITTCVDVRFHCAGLPESVAAWNQKECRVCLPIGRWQRPGCRRIDEGQEKLAGWEDTIGDNIA
jgi:hypothetical protein